MSWTLNLQVSRTDFMQGDPIGEGLIRAFIERRSFDDGDAHHTAPAPIENQLDNTTSFEAFNQVARAVDCARTLVGAMGGNWARLNIAVSGHANPDQQAHPGWANDSVHVSVSIMDYLVVDTAPEAPTPAALQSVQ